MSKDKKSNNDLVLNEQMDIDKYDIKVENLKESIKQLKELRKKQEKLRKLEEEREHILRKMNTEHKSKRKKHK